MLKRLNRLHVHIQILNILKKILTRTHTEHTKTYALKTNGVKQ